MENNLPVEPTFQVFETQQILIALEISAKTHAANNLEIFKKVVCAQLKQQVESRILIHRSARIRLIRSLQKTEINL